MPRKGKVQLMFSTADISPLNLFPWFDFCTSPLQLCDFYVFTRFLVFLLGFPHKNVSLQGQERGLFCSMPHA